MAVIDLDPLSEARTRLLTDTDRAIWDTALEAIQSIPATSRALCETVLSLVGRPKGLDLAALMFPHDDPHWAARYLLAASTCALTRERGLEYAGVDAPFLSRPYATRIGTALSAEVGLAQRHGAWVDATSWTPGGTLPDLGDGVVIGAPGPGARGLWSKGAGYGGAHIFTALHAEGEELHSCDGGQGAPADIALRTREIVEVHGELWFGVVGAGRDPYDMRPNKGRRCYGWTRTAMLPLRHVVADTEPAPPM